MPRRAKTAPTSAPAAPPPAAEKPFRVAAPKTRRRAVQKDAAPDAGDAILGDKQLGAEYLRRRGADIRWLSESGRWMFWRDGEGWEPQTGDPVTAELMDLGTDLVVKEVNGQLRPAPERGGRAGFARSAVAYTREQRPVKTVDGDWDTAEDPSDNVLGLPGGKLIEVDGTELRIRPRTRGDLVSKATAVEPCEQGEWLGSADKPTVWGQHVGSLFDDHQTAIQFHRLCGAGLIGRGKETFALLVGPGGTGKTSTCEAILRAVGTYGRSIPEEAVWGRLLGHPTSRTEFHGRRFAVVSEGPPDVAMDTSFVKKLTGGEDIDARRMREDTITFRFDGLLMLYGNHTPTLRADSGINRRMRVFRFIKKRYNEHAGQKPDRFWLRTVDLRHVLGWLLDGARDFLEFGLGDADAVDADTDDLLLNADDLAGFVQERLVVDGQTESLVKDVFGAYKAWAREEAVPEPMGRRALINRLCEFDPRISRIERSSHGARVHGVYVNPMPDDG